MQSNTRWLRCVESLSAAAIDIHEPNEVLFALDVTFAENMNIEFKHPRIVVIVPPEKSARRQNGKTWYHIVNHSNQRYTTETSALDDFIAKPGELKSLVNKASQGKVPPSVVNIKPSVESMCSSAVSSQKRRFLSQEQAPASQKPHHKHCNHKHCGSYDIVVKYHNCHKRTGLYTRGHSKTQAPTQKGALFPHRIVS